MKYLKIAQEDALLIADYIQKGNISETAKPSYIVEILRFKNGNFEIVEYDARENNSSMKIYSREEFIQKLTQFSLEYYQNLINKIKGV